MASKLSTTQGVATEFNRGASVLGRTHFVGGNPLGKAVLTDRLPSPCLISLHGLRAKLALFFTLLLSNMRS